jgi:hypothetical protein
MNLSDIPTGQQMALIAAKELGETKSTLESIDSVLWERHVRAAVRHVARKSEGYVNNALVDIVQNQREYMVPRMPFRIFSVHIVWPGGNKLPISVKTQQQMDAANPLWLSNNGVAVHSQPMTIVIDGATVKSKIHLYPIPYYSMPQGLDIYGAFDDAGWVFSDECPLDDAGTDLAIMYAKYLRCFEFKYKSAEYAAQSKEIKLLFDERLIDYMRDIQNRNVGDLMSPAATTIFGFGGQ